MTSTIKIATPKLLPEPVPEMRPGACQHCPSAHHPPDPECLDILAQPKEIKLETAFPCGWDSHYYCRGYCLRMGITNADLASKRKHQLK